MTGRFDQLLREARPAEFAEKHGLQHREAFCLMWYGCACGHQERIWNSRDGVTPFGTLCPSCGEPNLKHVRWREDVYAPDHKPAAGQRLWVSMTRERAMAIAESRVKQFRDAGRDVEMPAERMQALADSIFHDGQAPALDLHGYTEAG